MDQAFTWASSTMSNIECIQNDLWADGTFCANCAPICTDTNTVSKQKEERFHMTHVTKGFRWVHRKWFLSQSYVRRKCFTYLASWLALSTNGSSYHLSLITSAYHQVCPKWFSEPMVCLVQTVHLSCSDPNTVSKWKEVTFHMTHVT
jgi:hypothetical protein